MKLSKKLLNSTMVLTLLISGSGATATAKANSNVENPQIYKYSGKELLRGLAFGQGRAAKEFKSMYTDKMIKQANDKKAIAFVDSIFKEIEKKDPKFFNQFQKDLYSGNHLVIDEAMSNAAIKINKIMGKKGVKTINQNSVSPNCLWLFAAGAAALQYVVAAQIAVGLELAYVYAGYKFWPKSVEGNSELEKEIVINKIAESLAQ